MEPNISQSLQETLFATLYIHDVYEQKDALSSEKIHHITEQLRKHPEIWQNSQATSELVVLSDKILSSNQADGAELVNRVCAHLVHEWTQQERSLNEWLQYQHVSEGIIEKVVNSSLDTEHSLFTHNNTLFISHREFVSTKPELLWPKLNEQCQIHSQLEYFSVQGTHLHLPIVVIQTICEKHPRIAPELFLSSQNVKCEDGTFPANLGILHLLFTTIMDQSELFIDPDTKTLDLQASQELVKSALQWTATQNPQIIIDNVTMLLEFANQYSSELLMDACFKVMQEHIATAPLDHDHVNRFIGWLAGIDERSYYFRELTQQLLDRVCPFLESCERHNVDILVPWRAYITENKWDQPRIQAALDQGISNVLCDVLQEDCTPEAIATCNEVLSESKTEYINLSEVSLDENQLKTLLSNTSVQNVVLPSQLVPVMQQALAELNITVS